MACITTSFFFYESIFCVCVYHIVFIHSSADGHLSCLLVFPITNSAAMNIAEQVFV